MSSLGREVRCSPKTLGLSEDLQFLLIPFSPQFKVERCKYLILPFTLGNLTEGRKRKDDRLVHKSLNILNLYSYLVKVE